MRTHWLATIASAWLMVWSAQAGASPSFDSPLDPPIEYAQNQTPHRYSRCSFNHHPMRTRVQKIQGDSLYASFTTPIAIMDDTIKPAVAWTGSFSSIDTRQIVRIEDAKAWQDLWTRHQGDSLEHNALGFPVVPEIDFDHFMVVAIFAGEGPGSAGYGLAEAREVVGPGMTVRDGPPPAGTRVLRVRLAARVYQTAGDLDPPTTAAYGIFVLPRSDLTMHIELAQYHLIGEPPTWKRAATLPPGLRPARSK